VGNHTKQRPKSDPVAHRAVNRSARFLLNAIGLVMDAIQKRIGIRRMAYIFVLPNMLLFATFSLLPILGNFYYAFTGGTKVLPENRYFAGTTNFEFLLQCDNHLEPSSCRADLFWRGLFNTVQYVVFAVGGILLFSLITAIILNRPIKGRGFFRGVFFYPTLLSSVVVALLWKWILQRQGILNAGLTGLGLEPVNFLLDAAWSKVLGRLHRRLVQCRVLYIDCIGWFTGDPRHIV
jgi:alpha-1,4-digalacturonate transport system permease protein